MTGVSVSIYGPSIRTESLIRLSSLLKDSSTTFEIIFCGPNKIESPDFTYITSQVKPSQCAEIARRQCKGEVVMLMADDLIPTPKFVDSMYECYLQANDQHCIVGCHLVNGKNKLMKQEDIYRYRGISTSPVNDRPSLALCPMINRRILDASGGIDRNFIAICWDADYVLKLCSERSHIIRCESGVREDKKVNDNIKRLSHSYGGYDLQTLNNLWVNNNGIFLKQRSKSFEPFDDKEIMNKTQGNKGMWD